MYKSIGMCLLVLINLSIYGQKVVNNHDPVWSPDGKKIAYYSNLDGDFEIFVMDADGQNKIQLTENEVGDGNPSWSPDGTYIIFTSNRSGRSELYKIILETNEITQITDTEANEGASTFSPDGKMLAVEVKTGDNHEIIVMNVDGSKRVNVSNHPDRDYRPSWSTDGKTVYFQSKRTGKYQIHTVNPDGIDCKILFSSAHHNVNPSVMNKTNELIFVSHESDTVQKLLAINLDSMAVRQVSTGLTDFMLPTLSPDDEEIIFAMTKDKVSNIYKLTVADGTVTQLTGN